MPVAFDVAGLTARRVRPAHLDGLTGLDRDETMMATLGGVRPTATTEAHLGYDIEQWETHGFGMYVLVSQHGEVVGRVGLRSTVLAGRDEVEIAYSLLPDWQGQGIATAAVQRIVALASLTGLSRSVVASVEAANSASLRVLDKAGFVYEQPVERAGEPMALYRLVFRPEPWGEGPGPITADGCPVELYAALPADGRAGLVHHQIPPGASVLDLGCGTGRIADSLAEYGHCVTGVDNSPDMLAHLRHAETIRADIASLRLDRRYDVVVLASNLINQPDPTARQQLLAVAAAHLTPSGQVLAEWEPPSWFDRWTTGQTTHATIGDIDTDLTVRATHADLLSATITYTHGERRWAQHFTARRLDIDDLHQALTNAGLRLQALFGPGDTWIDAGAAR